MNSSVLNNKSLTKAIESMNSIVLKKKSLKKAIELINSMIWGKPGLRLAGSLAGLACLATVHYSATVHWIKGSTSKNIQKTNRINGFHCFEQQII